MRRTKIAVIGAGVIGLTSAYSVKLFDENIDVTVYAEKFSPNTTSNVAAGAFKFHDNKMRDTPTHLLQKWGASSYKWLKENHLKETGVEMGISLTSGYVSDTWLSIVDHYWLTPKQLEEFGPGLRSGVFVTSFMCDCNRYLPWLLDRFKEKNGKVVQKKIQSFDELATYDIIINCSGLGAVELCNDKNMEPYRGQVARVKAPWIRHWYNIQRENVKPSHIVYIYPNTDNVVVGVTNEVSWDLNPSDAVRNKIFEEAEKLLPSLKQAEFLGDWVGLRPTRTSVRLEKEERVLKASPSDVPRNVKIVHNYGQGPYGVTFSWGCAQHTVELVAECIEELRCQQVISRL